jgi:hypothetical protein
VYWTVTRFTFSRRSAAVELLTPYYLLLLTPYSLLVTTYYLLTLLTPYSLLLTTYYLLLTTYYYLLLTTYYLLLTTYYLLLTTCYLLLAGDDGHCSMCGLETQECHWFLYAASIQDQKQDHIDEEAGLFTHEGQQHSTVCSLSSMNMSWTTKVIGS